MRWFNRFSKVFCDQIISSLLLIGSTNVPNCPEAYYCCLTKCSSLFIAATLRWLIGFVLVLTTLNLTTIGRLYCSPSSIDCNEKTYSNILQFQNFLLKHGTSAWNSVHSSKTTLTFRPGCKLLTKSWMDELVLSPSLYGIDPTKTLTFSCNQSLDCNWSTTMIP